MECPVCKNQMIILELKQIEIDHCLSCKGVWLDSGELQLIVDESTAAENFLKSHEEVENSIEEKYKCPICRKKMKKIRFTKNELEFLVLDLCSEHGIWFDKGELEEVVNWIGAQSKEHTLSILHEIFANEIKK